MQTTEFQVTGMTCAHCETSVREEIEALPRVVSVEVSHKTGKLRVRHDRSLTDAEILAAVEEAGYSAQRLPQAQPLP